MARNPHDGLIRRYRDARREIDDGQLEAILAADQASGYDVERDEYLTVMSVQRWPRDQSPEPPDQATVAHLVAVGEQYATRARLYLEHEARLEARIPAAEWRRLRNGTPYHVALAELALSVPVARVRAATPRRAPRARRRAGASSSTSGSDPGDPDPEPAPALVFIRREPRAWYVAESCTVDRAGWVHVRDGHFEERTGPNYSTRRRFGRPGRRSWAPGEVRKIVWGSR